VGDAFLAAFGDDVGGAELHGQPLPGRVPAHGDDPLGAQFPGGDEGAQADRAVTDDDGGGTGPDLGGDGRVPVGVDSESKPKVSELLRQSSIFFLSFALSSRVPFSCISRSSKLSSG
jgi:hypothetical protein